MVNEPREEGKTIQRIVDGLSCNGDIGEEAKYSNAMHHPIKTHLGYEYWGNKFLIFIESGTNLIMIAWNEDCLNSIIAPSLKLFQKTAQWWMSPAQEEREKRDTDRHGEPVASGGGAKSPPKRPPEQLPLAQVGARDLHHQDAWPGFRARRGKERPLSLPSAVMHRSTVAAPTWRSVKSTNFHEGRS